MAKEFTKINISIGEISFNVIRVIDCWKAQVSFDTRPDKDIPYFAFLMARILYFNGRALTVDEICELPVEDFISINDVMEAQQTNVNKLFNNK